MSVGACGGKWEEGSGCSWGERVAVAMLVEEGGGESLRSLRCCCCYDGPGLPLLTALAGVQWWGSLVESPQPASSLTRNSRNSQISTLLAGLTSHVPAARNAYAHRLLTPAPRPRSLPFQPSSSGCSDDGEDTARPRTPIGDAAAATERPSTFRLRALAMHGVALHVGRGGALPIARHTGLPRHPPLSGEGAWVASCIMRIVN